MSAVIHILKTQRENLERQIADASEELRRIDIALKALADSPRPQEPPAKTAPTTNGKRSPMTVDEAMLEAIRKGQSAPKPIHDWIAKHFHIQTTRGSVSTKLWRLRRDEIVKFDGRRWYVDEDKIKEGPKESKVFL